MTDGVQLLDVGTGLRIGVPMKVDGIVVNADGISWSEDGTGMWISGGNATDPGAPRLVRFVVDPDRWRAIACGVVHRELTAEEWKSFVSDTEPQVAACP